MLNFEVYSKSADNTLLSTSAIATISYFNGNMQYAIPELKKRLGSIIEINPWLLGGLTQKGKRDQISIRRDSYVHFRVEDLIDTPMRTLDRNTPYNKLYEQLERYLVPTANDLINKAKPIINFTLIPFNDCRGYCLVMSASKLVFDGYSFYQLYNSLRDDSPIPLISPCLNDTKSIEPQNFSHYRIMQESGYMEKLLDGILAPSQTHSYCFRIDSESLLCKDKKDLPLESLATGLAHAARAKEVLLDMSLRNDKERTLEAGNFETAKVVDIESYTPKKELNLGLLGRTLSGMVYVCQSFSYAKQIVLNKNLAFMHIPLINPKYIRSESALLIRVTDNELGVLLFSKRCSKTELIANLPLKEPLYQHTFESE